VSSDFDSVGKPVKPPSGAAVAHEYTTRSGEKVVVARDARGRLLPGHRLADTRDPAKLGRPVVDPKSAIRRALGLPCNPWRKPK